MYCIILTADFVNFILCHISLLVCFNNLNEIPDLFKCVGLQLILSVSKISDYITAPIVFIMTSSCCGGVDSS